MNTKPLFISVLLFGATTLAQVQQEWVARHANGGANAIALDPAGNVYVTGSCRPTDTGPDYCTLKYDNDGNELWFARYDGPGHGTDVPLSIAVAAEGNVYVAGYSVGTDRRTRDYATVKYDNFGNELWVARYDGPAHGDDTLFAMTIDGDQNVYATGRSQDTPTSATYATIKYDRDGTELWVARYIGPGWPSIDQATAIAVDPWGNVLVTGRSLGGPTTGYNYTTIKYDPEGNQLWVARYDGPMHGSPGESANAIAVDSAGAVYVTGSSGDVGDRSAFATVKYDPDGNELWAARYMAPGALQVGKSIAVDAGGNVYVTGLSAGAVHQNYATVKYDPDGNQIWVARSQGDDNDFASQLVLDAAGNVYVTGSTQTGEGSASDYATIKYDSAAGQQVWVARYHGPLATSGDGGSALALDSAGNVYVTGVSWRVDPSEPNACTIKYSPAP